MKTSHRLFAAFMWACLLGGIYGWVSAQQNQNPFDAHTDMAQAWHWKPSAVWLPSYVLCKFPPNGVGIAYTRSGYCFRSDQERTLYFAASTVLGGALGAVVCSAWLFGRARANCEPKSSFETTSTPLI